MSGSNVELFGDWDDWLNLMSSARFERRLATHMRRANRRIGLLLTREVRTEIRRGNYAPNSPLTRAIKGSSKPLVDNGDLFRSITYDLDEDGFGLMVGVKRNARNRDGTSTTSIAHALHEGYTIDLRKHPAVRKAVFAKLRREGRNKDFRPRGVGGATVWVVPPRPFIENPVRRVWNTGEVVRHWREAFVLALHDLA